MALKVTILSYYLDIPYRWPEGVYGILTRDPCPKTWSEFTHCITMECSGRTPVLPEFKLNLGPCDARKTTITLRYCFKGANVTSRPGGFGTKSGIYGNAFVIKTINDDCAVYGEDGGKVKLDYRR